MGTTYIADTQMYINDFAIGKSPVKLLPKDIIAVVVRSGILRHTLPIALVPFQTTVNQDIKAMSVNTKIAMPRYVFYAMYANKNDILLKTRKAGGTVESIEVKKLLEYRIPLPSIKQQERIVAILDRFDTLCNDLTSGLPAEIEARRKQYEYYRDKLLTFPEATA